jgi:hypothetical protein
MAFGMKKRGPYDKVIKHVLELFRQELQPLESNQQIIIAQNEKILEFLRQIWKKEELPGAVPFANIPSDPPE